MKKHKKPDQSQYVTQGEKIKDKVLIREFKWTPKQQQFIDLALNKDTKIIFVSGPAGSSKTLLATYIGLTLINRKNISDIIYLRTAVESADSKIGYLPGELEAKMSVYATPLYDKLEELLHKNDIQNLAKENRISMLVPNFIRGASWTTKLAIIDECIAGHHFIVTDTGKVSLRSLEENFRLGKPLPQIKTFNEKLKIFEYKPIKKVWSKGVKKIITVKAGNRKIDCTPNHLFLTSHGWKRADSLLAGDILIANDENAHNNFLKYNQIVCDGFVDENKSLEVFDMEVEDNHNFIIACSTRGEHGNNSGMVVHNCQNITQKEIITIITRIGKFSKCILLADPEQSDLFNGKAGGFVKIRDAFNDEEAKKQGVFTFEFTADDIMRSELVKFIVKRLEQTDVKK